MNIQAGRAPAALDCAAARLLWRHGADPDWRAPQRQLWIPLAAKKAEHRDVAGTVGEEKSRHCCRWQLHPSLRALPAGRAGTIFRRFRPADGKRQKKLSEAMSFIADAQKVSG
ncbi:hypothetical protein [Pantoea ananatis]|uniref:hypothetical protein n=1 Tax=Pantoea ananas TaxID=553 RepID=UPI0021F6ACB8|nr:hypothetical protein [Pantoea ananatis]